MVEIDVVYEGDLRTRCRHGPSGAELITDAPVDNQGLGRSFSPTDLVATALGSCMLTIMGMVARRHQWPFEGARVHVEKHMVAEPVRRIGRLLLRFEMPPDLPETSRALLERAAHTCPVNKSLNPNLELDLVFDWGS